VYQAGSRSRKQGQRFFFHRQARARQIPVRQRKRSRSFHSPWSECRRCRAMKRKRILLLATAETIGRDPAAGRRRALLTRVVRRRQRTCLVRLLVPAAEPTGVVAQHASHGRGDVTRRLPCMGRGLGKREPFRTVAAWRRPPKQPSKSANHLCSLRCLCATWALGRIVDVTVTAWRGSLCLTSSGRKL
jgi:hypothetical protein